MNRFRWVAVCIAGAAILIFTQFPYAATMQTRVEYAAGEMNYNATIKSKSDGAITAAMEMFAK